jgi:hypothetical protein
MGSFKAPDGAFQPDQIDILTKAFDAVWQTLIAHRPSQADNDELRTAISKRLCELAAAGITDVQELRRVTLDALELEPRQG